jgi:putative monooxygenase ydhR
MSEQLLQINFGLNVTPAEYRAFAASVAETVAQVPGLRWKVWFLDENARAAGGIYLFEDEPTLEAYLASDIVNTVRTHPALRNATFKHAAVMPEVTAVTRGPVGATVSA